MRTLNISAPPIGLAYIGAFLRDHGHNVTIIDAEVEQLNNEQIAQQAEKADLAGITTTAPTYNSALVLANLIKQSNNNTTVVLGGPQATFLDEECLGKSAADAASEARGNTLCWTSRAQSNQVARVTLTVSRTEMQTPSSKIPIGS